MEVEEELFPLQLEKLLPEWSEGDNASKGVREDGLPLSKFESTDIDSVLKSFQFHLRDLLSTIPEDDPLVPGVQTEICLPELQDKAFIVQEMPGKGMGAIATRRIPAGSIVLEDPFALSVEEPARTPETEEDANYMMKSAILQLLDQYTQLPVSSREQLAGLHAHIKPETRNWFRSQLKTPEFDVTDTELDFIIRLYCTFNTNEFDKVLPGESFDWKTRRLFLTTSRINHSCQPNVRSSQTTDGHKVVTALRDIEPGEELALKYMDHYLYNRKDWEAMTEWSWGFVCSCPGCRWK